MLNRFPGAWLALAWLLALAACGGPAALTPTPLPPPAPTAAAAGVTTLLVTNQKGRTVSYVDTNLGVVTQVEVGASPWGIALAPDGRAYISTAEGVAVVDTRARRRVALMAYQSRVGPVSYGEYRPGGMGIAVAPDGRQVYVGIHRSGGGDRLEIFDAQALTVTGSVPIGIRPFQVLTRRDGREVYSLDHDSYQVTVVDPWDGLTVVDLQTGATRELPVPDRPLDVVVLP